MKITGPERYRLSTNSERFTVAERFSRLAMSRLPKLYIATVKEWPIYVGTTRQPMRSRLRYGFQAKGESGYYGYAWRHKFSEVQLDIWYHEDAPVENPVLDMETVEAEVVHLIRCAGQWPECQTEIHFHPSSKQHRDAAAAILGTYTSRSPRESTG
jgi:hypothetical protein